jgi:hypothetical protein
MSAPDMIDRYDALCGLDSFDFHRKKYILSGVLKKENFHAIRAEAYRQMANQDAGSVFSPADLMNENKSSIKLAYLKADTLLGSHFNVFKAALSDSSYAVVELALDKIMKSDSVSMLDKIHLLSSTNTLTGQNNAIRCKWYEYAATYDNMNRPDFISKLTVLAGPTYEFRTRVNAAQTLKRLNECNSAICSALFDAVCAHNARLAGPCAEVLRHFMDNAEKRQMITNEALKLTEEQRKTLGKYKILDVGE